MKWKIGAVIGVIVFLLVMAAAASALSNVGLPARSQIVEQLSEAEKARLAELGPAWLSADAL
jgi:hypothetical protein